jgi:hypothetical protein
MRRVLSIALRLVLTGAALAFAVDVTTIRADPGVFPYDFVSTQTAFPGELISVELGQDWTPIVSSDTGVVGPWDVRTNPSKGWFIALSPGQAILHASSAPRCPRCDQADVLWSMTINAVFRRPSGTGFPPTWSADQIMHAVSDVATDPNLIRHK